MRSPDTSSISLRILGPLDVRDASHREIRSVLSQPKRLALLSYLALSGRGGFCHRDSVVALFWPEFDQVRARGALRQALSWLRRELGKAILITRGEEEVRVAAELLRTDAVEFDEALAASDPERALSLYRGDLLDGVFVANASPEFERWLEDERARLRREANRSALGLVDREAAAGRLNSAVSWARRATALAPHDEASHRRLIELLQSAGDRAGAVEAYTGFRERLLGDFGVEPSERTRRLISEPLEPAPYAEPSAARVSVESAASNPQSSGASAAATRYPTHVRRSRLLRVGGVMASALLLLAVLSLVSPVRTFLSRGSLPHGATIVISDFVDRTRDSLSVTIAEAVRVGLSQSPAIQLLQRSRVRQALGLMLRDTTATLTPELAREMALREGAAAVLGGEIRSLGRAYVLSLSLIDAESGDELLLQRETAADSSQLIEAVDRLVRQVRERIGESLRSIQASPALARVTTTSLPALRLYTQSMRVGEAGDYEARIRLLRHATSVDTTFAQAYRVLALQLNQFGGSRREQIDALTRAFRLRDRLPDSARYKIAADYYTIVIGDDRAAIREYQRVLDLDSNNVATLNNLAATYASLRDVQRYRHTNARLVQLIPRNHRARMQEVTSLISAGHQDSAAVALARFDSIGIAAAGYRHLGFAGVGLGFARRDYAMVRHYAGLFEKSGTIPAADGEMYHGIAAAIEGRLREAELYFHRSIDRARIPSPSIALSTGALLGQILAAQRDKAAARAYLNTLVTAIPLDSMDALDRPYGELAIAYLRAGDLPKARNLVAESAAILPPELREAEPTRDAHVRGVLALSERHFTDAVRHLRAADSGVCYSCVLPDLALAYDLAANRDSAIAGYERYLSVAARDVWRSRVDAIALPHALRRLGELYEERGEIDKALGYYRQFVDLRKSADAALQSEVTEVRTRITRLISGQRKARSIS